MKKIFKIAFASLLAFSIAPALAVAFNQNKEATSVQAVETVATADQVKYQDGDTVKTFEELPAGYTFENGVLTVTSESTKDYSIWVDDGSAGRLTIVFERDYGANSIVESKASNIYFGYKGGHGTYGGLVLTSTTPVNVTLGAIDAKYRDLTISGKINVNIAGPDLFTLSLKFDNVVCSESFHLLDEASLICVDSIFKYAGSSSCNLVEFKEMDINTTGCINVGFIRDPLSSPEGTAYSLYFNGGIEDFNLVKCDGGIYLYSKSMDAYRDLRTREDLKLEEYAYLSYRHDYPEKPWQFYHYTFIKPYSVIYEPNGGSGEQEPYGGRGGIITLPDCTFTAPEGKQFKCWARWNESGDQYYAGATFEVNKDVEFYAIWEDLPAAALTGTVTITGNLKYNKTLTAIVTDTNNSGTLSYQWRRNGEPIGSATSSTYVVTEDDIGYTLSVVVSSSVETGSIVGTASDSISKADGPAAPSGLSATACTTTDNNDGTISGVTTTMEYKLSSAADWTSGTGETLTGLDAGTYYVRVKETATHNAGEIANVVVNAYNAPVLYSVTVNKGTANPVSAVAGTTITITADEAEDGYEFDKWVSSSGVVFADANSKTTTFTMPEKNVIVTATYKLIPVPELDSITLSGTYKTEFEVGDTFSYDGLVVTAHYTNGGADKVVTGYVVSVPDMSTPGEKTITVTYTENEVTKTATYKINVSEKVVPPEPPVTPTSNGLSGGAVAGIVVGSILVAGIGGFALVWFVIKKKTWADFVAIFKKK